jgi:uncharacterized membrane protein YvbJ
MIGVGFMICRECKSESCEKANLINHVEYNYRVQREKQGKKQIIYFVFMGVIFIALIILFIWGMES